MVVGVVPVAVVAAVGLSTGAELVGGAASVVVPWSSQTI